MGLLQTRTLSYEVRPATRNEIIQKYSHQYSKNISTNIPKIFTPIFQKYSHQYLQKYSDQYSKNAPTNIPKIFPPIFQRYSHQYFHHHRHTIKSKSPKNILCSQQSATMAQIIPKNHLKLKRNHPKIKQK